MAERRMFSKSIIDSDNFLDLPLSTQDLYFHLSMRADDDGFLNNSQKITRMIGATKEDLNLLVKNRFIILFESGICVITHWKIHNYIRNDRYKPTIFQEEFRQLKVNENKLYIRVLKKDDGGGIPFGSKSETQVSLGKNRLDEDRLGKGSSVQGNILGECNLSEDNLENYNSNTGKEVEVNYTDKKVLEFVHKNNKINNQSVDNIDKKTKNCGQVLKNENELNIESLKRDKANYSIKTGNVQSFLQDNKKQIIDKWNSLNISKIYDFTPKRIQLLVAIMEQYDYESIFKAIDNIGHSDFLQGNNKSNWRISFDWFINIDNFFKVLEGQYNNVVKVKSIDSKKFNNFRARDYDYDKLERRLLGWE